MLGKKDPVAQKKLAQKFFSGRNIKCGAVFGPGCRTEVYIGQKIAVQLKIGKEISAPGELV